MQQSNLTIISSGNATEWIDLQSQMNKSIFTSAQLSGIPAPPQGQVMQLKLRNLDTKRK